MIASKELEIITRQIKRTPENAITVVKYCSYGFPMVIESFPILNGKPFPTLYWLTCPFLRNEISKMESDGWIKRYEETIAKSSEFLNSQIKAHELAKKNVMDLLQDDVLRMKFIGGMGGTRNFKHVKCLHMHVAYHLGGIENPIGKSVLSKINRLECKNGICLEWSV